MSCVPRRSTPLVPGPVSAGTTSRAANRLNREACQEGAPVPPSAASVAPVLNAALSEARKRMASAISSDPACRDAGRPSGAAAKLGVRGSTLESKVRALGLTFSVAFQTAGRWEPRNPAAAASRSGRNGGQESRETPATAGLKGGRLVGPASRNDRRAPGVRTVPSRPATPRRPRRARPGRSVRP